MWFRLAPRIYGRSDRFITFSGPHWNLSPPYANFTRREDPKFVMSKVDYATSRATRAWRQAFAIESHLLAPSIDC